MDTPPSFNPYKYIVEANDIRDANEKLRAFILSLDLHEIRLVIALVSQPDAVVLYPSTVSSKFRILVPHIVELLMPTATNQMQYTILRVGQVQGPAHMPNAQV